MFSLQYCGSCPKLALLGAWFVMLLVSSTAFVIPYGTCSTQVSFFNPPMKLLARRTKSNGAKKTERPPLNDEIAPGDVRVVVHNPVGKDEPLGILDRDVAIQRAYELGGLDLILVNANSNPPVCQISEYSKYRYQQERKAKEARKQSKSVDVKEVKMSYNIDVHDYDVRMNKAMKFLQQGNRVKLTVTFRGREIQHRRLGYDLLEKTAGELDKLSTRQGQPRQDGPNLSMTLLPRPEVLKEVNERRKAGEKAKKQKREERLGQKVAEASS